MDLIQLDIEGLEVNALVGGMETIETYRPIVVIEEKQLPQYDEKKMKEARVFLESLDYQEIGRVHKDVIFGWGV